MVKKRRKHEDELDIYNEEDLDFMDEDGDLDSDEAGFMRGYLGR